MQEKRILKPFPACPERGFGVSASLTAVLVHPGCPKAELGKKKPPCFVKSSGDGKPAVGAEINPGGGYRGRNKSREVIGAEINPGGLQGEKYIQGELQGQK